MVGVGQLLLLMLCGFGPPRIGDQLALPAFEVQSADLRSVRQARMPALTAKSAILLDFASGRVLYSKAVHQKLSPASTTKMMTALLTLEQGQLQSEVTVSPLAAGQIGTRMGLQAGQRFAVRDLLFGLFLPSGNDAAVALAEHDGPSLQGFVDRLNTRARELGLADSHFMNPHGLDAPTHLSSAYDLSRLARYALRSQPLFDQYVSTEQHTIPPGPGHPAFDLTNTNQLLGKYAGADGVKTGTTPAAAEVLVSSVTRDDHRLLAVVMGSTDRYADSRAMMDNGFASFTWLRPDTFFPYALPMIVRDTADVVLPVWQAGQVRAFLDADDMTATFSLAGKDVLAVPLEALP